MLGWALNLGFAGSGAGEVAAIARGFLLLGVGRCWWVWLMLPLLAASARL
jgi:hypothetical protein